MSLFANVQMRHSTEGTHIIIPPGVDVEFSVFDKEESEEKNPIARAAFLAHEQKPLPQVQCDNEMADVIKILDKFTNDKQFNS